MKLCGECGKTPLPYVIVIVVSAFSAFLSWLTLPLLGVSSEARLWLTVAIFIAVGVLLLTYMVSCIRRHCRHVHVAHG